jgi:hypothetical protein
LKRSRSGSLTDVEILLSRAVSLEETDYWERTAWLIAIQTGDVAKADLLRRHGANTAACGRCGKPPLFYAIENHKCAMLRWLLAAGLDPEQTDEFGTTSLITAVEADDLDCIEALLAANPKIDRVYNGGTAISSVQSRPVALRLLAAGADPAELSNEGRRVLVGLPAEPSENALDVVSAEEFGGARTRRFGTANPEKVTEPFGEAMIRAGATGYTANERFGGPSSFGGEPVWCAQRFGQTVTLLPDGRAVQIAGELPTGLCLSVLFPNAYADAPSNVPVQPNQKMETDTATAALTLIRQRKFEEARTLLLTSAEKGDAASQGLLGQMYNAGWGLPVDYKEAFKWWSRAVAGGSTDALWGLGLLYDEGNGVARDSKKAAELWKQGSEQGNIKATVNLAFYTRKGGAFSAI